MDHDFLSEVLGGTVPHPFFSQDPRYRTTGNSHLSLSLTGYSAKYLPRYQLRDVCDTGSPAKIKGHGVTEVISRQGLINVIISIIILLPSTYLLGSAVFQKNKKERKPKTKKSIPYPLAS